MSTSIRVEYRIDPGHGWLVVNHLQLQLVGLSPADFSAFSYKTDGRYALEEDCDMPKFMKAAEDKGIGVELKIKHLDNDSSIRRWRSINE